MPTIKQMERAAKAFDSACKEASNCRAKRNIVSCFGCDDYKGCPTQERVERNLAIKRGETHIKP